MGNKKPLNLDRKECLKRLGLPERQLRRLIAAKLLTPTGSGLGQTFPAAQVEAVARLWTALEPLLPAEPKRTRRERQG